MKITNNKKVPVWTVALLTLALASAPTQASDENSAASKTPAKQEQSVKSTEKAPAAYNKATGIIGMDVKNENDENLGHVRDVVFDLNTERVSYVVMGVKKGFLGWEEKYVAVPINTLKASPNGKYFILNADKEQVALAAGFDAKHWPSVGNQSWGADTSFWQSNDSTRSRMDEQSNKADLPATDKPDKSDNKSYGTPDKPDVNPGTLDSDQE